MPLETYNRSTSIEPGRIVSGAGYESVSRMWDNVGRLSNNITDTAFTFADKNQKALEQEGKQAGEKAVWVDPDTNQPQVVGTLPEGTRPYALAYRKAAEARYTAQLGLSSLTKLSDISNANSTNPESFRASWDGYSKGITDSVPEEFKNGVDLLLKEMGVREYYKLQTKDFERTKQEAEISTFNLVDSLERNTVDSLRNTGLAGGTPEFLQGKIAETKALLDDQIQAGIITPAQGNERLKNFQQSLVRGVVTGEVLKLTDAKNVSGAKKFLEDFVRTPNDMVNDVERNRIADYAYNEISAHVAKSNTQAKEDLQNTVTLLRNNKPVPKTEQERVVGSFTDAETQSLAAEEINRAASEGERNGKLAMAAPEDIQKMESDLLNRMNDTLSPDARRDATSALKEYMQFTQALEERNQLIKRDPAGYVLQHSPTAGPVFNDYMQSVRQYSANPNNPDLLIKMDESKKNYIQTMKAEQSRLGLQTPNIQLLTQGMVNDISIRVSSIQQAPENADALLRTLSNLHNEWGPDWPIVYKQLRQEKAIDGTIDVLAYMTDIDKQPAALALANAWAAGESLGKTLTDESKTQIKESVRSNFADLAQTFAIRNEDGQLANFYNAAEMLAKQYASRGVDPEKAAEDAYKAVIGDNYNVVGKARIPTAENPDTIARGAVIAKRKLDVEQLQPLASLATLSPEESKTELRNAIDNAYWVTQNGEGGLQLMYQNNDPVRFKNGNPVTLSWQALKDHETSFLDEINKMDKGSNSYLIRPYE